MYFGSSSMSEHVGHFNEESCAGRAVIGSDETHLHPLGVVMPAKNDHLRPSAGNFSDDVGHLDFAHWCCGLETVELDVVDIHASAKQRKVDQEIGPVVRV